MDIKRTGGECGLTTMESRLPLVSRIRDDFETSIATFYLCWIHLLEK